MKCNCRQFVSAGHLPACDHWAEDVDDEHRTPEEVYITKLEKALRELSEKAEALFDAMKSLSATTTEYDALRKAITNAKTVLGEEKKGETKCL